MGLEGKLTDMPLLDLLRVFQRSARSGKLTLWSETEWAGLWFQEGQVVSGVVVSRPGGRPLHIGEKALFHLFTWTLGQFRFSPEAESGSYQTNISRPTSVLIAEGLQHRISSAQAQASSDLTLQTPLSVVPQMEGAIEYVHLSVEEWFVLTHIRQHTTIQQVLSQTDLTADHVLLIVSHLIDYGLVMRAPMAALPQRRLSVERETVTPGTTQASMPMTNLTRAIKRRLQQIAVGA